MLSVRKLILFVVLFLTFGLVGALLDGLTGFKYGLMSGFTATATHSASMTGRWVRLARGAWFRSPVAALAFILSPVLFVFALLVSIYDLVRREHMWWGKDGTRHFYTVEGITEDMILANPRTAMSFFKSMLGQKLPDLTGTLFEGEPIPKGWAPENLLDVEARKKAQQLQFRRIGIQGQYWYAPPSHLDQTLGLDSYEVLGDEPNT